MTDPCYCILFKFIVVNYALISEFESLELIHKAVQFMNHVICDGHFRAMDAGRSEAIRGGSSKTGAAHE